MKAEKPPFESNSPKSHYDQRLLEIQEKCLPLLERLVEKFSDYRKISNNLKEKRPSLKWLNKLDATCEKIQNRMTAQFFEKLGEAERENRNNTDATLEESSNEIVCDRNQAENNVKTQKRSRWDVKPEEDIQKDPSENSIAEKKSPKYDGKRIAKSLSVSEKRHSTAKGLPIIDLTKTEDVERLSRQKIPRTKLKEVQEQDLDVEIIASTAGLNPLRRAKSQTQFVTLEEVNKSPFYKKFTSDNMILDSRAANLKYGTVFDLVKSKAQSNDPRHRKYSQRRYEGFSRRPSESQEPWSYRRGYENKKFQVDSFHKTIPFSHKKSQLTNFVSDKTYEHLQIAVKFFDKNDQSNVSSKPRFDNSLSTKYGKSGNEFQGKMPFYEQSVARNSRFSYPEKPFTTQHSKDPLPPPPPPPPPYPSSSETFPSSQSVTNAQFNNVGYPQQSCSFHCNCCKNTSYFPSMGASYQPTATCNYAFLHYFPNQPVISPANKNLPTPFPTFAVPPLSTAALTTSTPSYYSNASNPGYSVPVFCNEGSASTNKTTNSLLSWNASNNHHPELACRNTLESTCRSKDPRTDMKDRLTQSTSNISSMGSALTKTPCFSGISEERFSQSCTFLRPDNLYRDFKCHTDDFGNNSLESLKSFGLINNMTPGSESNKIGVLNKSDHKSTSNNELPCKIKESESNNCAEKFHNPQAEYQTRKQEGTVNVLNEKVKNSQENHTSPLSNLYNDSSAAIDGYFNVTNKHLENRKRKYDVLGRNFISSDIKRRNVGKVEPMTKLSHVQNKEFLTPKRNQNSENTSTLKNQEVSQSNKIENLSRIHDTKLSNESLGKIKSQVEWIEKEHQSYDQPPTTSHTIDYQPYKTSAKDKIPIPNESACKELIISENQSCQKENYVIKNKLLESGATLKKVKGKVHESYDSRANQSRPQKNIQELGKQKSAGKDKLLQNGISSKKGDTLKIEEHCSDNTQVKSCKSNVTSQKENLDLKIKEHENISSSKNIDGNHESSSNSPSPLLPSENIPVSKRRKSGGNEKETGPKKNNSSDKLLISKNQDNNKVASLPKEKISSTHKKSSEKISVPSVISKSNLNSKISQQGNVLNDQNVSSEKSNSVINKNSKISTPRKSRASNDRDKNSTKPSSSKKLSKTNSSSQSKIISQQENLAIQKEKLISNSMLKTIDRTELKQHGKLLTPTKVNTNSIINSHGMAQAERRISSKVRNIDQIKDCSVVLKKEQSVVTEKCVDNNINIERSEHRHFADKVTSPKIVKLHDMKTLKKNIADYKTLVSNNPKSTENKKICPRKKSMDVEKNTFEEMSNFDHDKIKDLVLRMKSLSQSEAIKVITEFASTLKVDESQQNASKDHNVYFNEKDTEHPTSLIKIKEETKDYYYTEPMEIENYITNERNDYLEITDSTAKPALHNTLENQAALSHAVELNQFNSCETKGERVTVIDESAYVKSAIIEIDMKNCHTVNKATEITSQKTSTNIIPVVDQVQKEQTEKIKFNKKKKLSELEKIHADLESCHGLDDIMKCSGFRTCRLKNESSITFKDSTTEDKQNKKRRVSVSPEESFFIQDEITIKMEPFPELTFEDFIKKEPEYFE